jgi:hypothetical protein
MEQSPSWEADSHSVSQEIPRLLWNPKVRYRVHKTPPLVPILNQMHSVHNFSPYFPMIHSNIILPSMSRSSEWSLYFRFSIQNFVIIYNIYSVCYISCQSPPPWLYSSWRTIAASHILMWGFVTRNFLRGRVVRLHSVWLLPFDLSGLGWPCQELTLQPA